VQVTPPPAQAVAAFLDAIATLNGNEGRVLLAVSGGPDSLAMLLLAKAAIPERISVATIDHGLRPEAATEAAFVAALCKELAISHTILVPNAPITGNVQANARIVRYKLLAEHADKTGCQWIATAHHADDQLETLLMRIARGSGINGLAGVRERQGRIIRPMLAFRKAELEQICAEVGIEPVRDLSNDNSDFDRVAMRQWLAGSEHPFDPLRAVKTSAALADAAEALEWMAGQLALSRMRKHGTAVIIDPNGLPNEIRRRLLQRALGEIEQGLTPRGDAIDRALIALESGQKITLGNVVCQGGKEWHFHPAPERRQ
jgi:tRNA(Ile)-lysidine synthase